MSFYRRPECHSSFCLCQNTMDLKWIEQISAYSFKVPLKQWTVSFVGENETKYFG